MKILFALQFIYIYSTMVLSQRLWRNNVNIYFHLMRNRARIGFMYNLNPIYFIFFTSYTIKEIIFVLNFILYEYNRDYFL